MRTSIIFIFLLSFFAGCEKGVDQKLVTYLILDSEAGYSLMYTDALGNKIKQDIVVASREDEWRYSFMADPGTIVYMSAVDTVPDSFVKLIIYVDGKVYKQGVRSQYPTRPVTVSGTVPFN